MRASVSITSEASARICSKRSPPNSAIVGSLCAHPGEGVVAGDVLEPEVGIFGGLGDGADGINWGFRTHLVILTPRRRVAVCHLGH